MAVGRLTCLAVALALRRCGRMAGRVSRPNTPLTELAMAPGRVTEPVGAWKLYPARPCDGLTEYWCSDVVNARSIAIGLPVTFKVSAVSCLADRPNWARLVTSALTWAGVGPKRSLNWLAVRNWWNWALPGVCTAVSRASASLALRRFMASVTVRGAFPVAPAKGPRSSADSPVRAGNGRAIDGPWAWAENANSRAQPTAVDSKFKRRNMKAPWRNEGGPGLR